MDHEGLFRAVKPPSPIKVEEKLTHEERRSVPYPESGLNIFGTDGADLMGSDLALSVQRKAFLFEVETVVQSSGKIQYCDGQVGFVYTVDQTETRVPRNHSRRCTTLSCKTINTSSARG
jgi:hypothetical protein